MSRRLLLPLVASLALAAQTPHYDQGLLVSARSGEWHDLGGIGHWDELAALDDGLNAPRLLTGPPLGRRGYVERLERWQGVTYAVAVLGHPLFERLGDAYDRDNHSTRHNRLPRALYRHRDGGPWERLATFACNPWRGLGTFIPLEDGRFLLNRWDPAFRLESTHWPLGIYRVGPAGLVLDAPLPLAGGGAGRTALRTAAGIVLLDGRTGDFALLANADARILRQERLPTLAGAPAPMLAAPRPDGLILLARPADAPLQPTSDRLRWHAYRKRPGLTPSTALAAARLEGAAPPPDAPRPVAVTWWLLDPGSGRLQALDPPRCAWDGSPFRVLPDGSLDFRRGPARAMPIALSDWLTSPVNALNRLIQSRRSR